MLTLARIARRLRRIVGRKSFERDLDDELQFHAQMALEQHVARGLSTTAAHRIANLEFGSMPRFKDEVRDAHGITSADDFWRDLKFSFRALRRTPGFTIIALITFALGIGANTAIFSVVNAAVLHPLPYPNGDRMITVAELIKGSNESGGVSVPNFRDWQRQATNVVGLGGYFASRMILGGEGEPERVRAISMSANLIPMLGVKPAIGRTFVEDEEKRGAPHVVMLSDALWRRRFGGNKSIVGKTIPVEGEAYTVVGVMPPSFNFPAEQRVADVWLPFMPPVEAEDPRARGWHWIGVAGLLKPGVTFERAEGEMRQIAARLLEQYPAQQANRTTFTKTMADAVVGDVRSTLFILMGAVGFVLLIACANVANLLLARNATRQKDVALRIALGARRGQIIRQFLTEGVVLALAGAALGAGIAALFLRILSTLGAGSLPVAGAIHLDGTVLLVLFAAALVCGIAFGIAPALGTSPANPRGGLSQLGVKSTSTREMRRFRNGLVVAQIALSLMLLVGAGLLMRGFVRLRATDPGLISDHVLTARIAVPARLQKGSIEAQQFLRPMLERVRAVPGVTGAGVTTLLPIEESGSQASFWVNNRPWPKTGGIPLMEIRSVSPGYFAAMGIPLRQGRDIGESDDSTGMSKVVVNESLVLTLLAGENPIGRRLMQGTVEQHDEFEIVGVVRDVKQSGLDTPARPEVYMSYADVRYGYGSGDYSLVVKTKVPELSVVTPVRAALHSVAVDVALTNVRPMDEIIERSLSQRKLTLMLFAMFATVALALAASGLYGVIYYIVTLRTREIGIRVALGAGKARVVRLVLGQSGRLVAGGIVIGTAGALALTRLLSGMVYGVGTRDPLTFVAVPLLLTVVALVASMVPAWRALRVDPVTALRSE